VTQRLPKAHLNTVRSLARSASHSIVLAPTNSPLRTVRNKNRCAIIPPALVLRCSRYPAISLQSAEVDVAKSDSKSVAYEFRTKSAQSGGLENNGRREGILGLGRCVAVRSFGREGPCLLVISGGSQAGGECWSWKDWRWEGDSVGRLGCPLGNVGERRHFQV
jgi:hypothetical protein